MHTPLLYWHAVQDSEVLVCKLLIVSEREDRAKALHITVEPFKNALDSGRYRDTNPVRINFNYCR